MISTVTEPEFSLTNKLIREKDTGDIVLVCKDIAVVVYSSGKERSSQLGRTWSEKLNNCFFRDYLIDGWELLPPGYQVNLSN